MVRARLHRGQRPNAQGRPRLDDRLRLRVQVQQRGVGVHPTSCPPHPWAVAHLYPQVSGGHSRRAKISQILEF